MRRILVAVDDSEGAGRALATAVALTQASGAKLLILTVSSTAFSDVTFRHHCEANTFDASFQGEEDEDILQSAEYHLLQEARDLAMSVGVNDITMKLSAGNPIEKIIETAFLENVDLLVIGRGRQGGAKSDPPGRVSRELINRAPCEVTVVP